MGKFGCEWTRWARAAQPRLWQISTGGSGASLTAWRIFESHRFLGWFHSSCWTRVYPNAFFRVFASGLHPNSASREESKLESIVRHGRKLSPLLAWSNEASGKEYGTIYRRYSKAPASPGKDYRSRALAMYPHICGRCAREFSGKKLKELTVHHKDHNHDNNPPDGSNWELLCMYCHKQRT